MQFQWFCALPRANRRSRGGSGSEGSCGREGKQSRTWGGTVVNTYRILELSRTDQFQARPVIDRASDAVHVQVNENEAQTGKLIYLQLSWNVFFSRRRPSFTSGSAANHRPLLGCIPYREQRWRGTDWWGKLKYYLKSRRSWLSNLAMVFRRTSSWNLREGNGGIQLDSAQYGAGLCDYFAFLYKDQRISCMNLWIILDASCSWR